MTTFNFRTLVLLEGVIIAPLSLFGLIMSVINLRYRDQVFQAPSAQVSLFFKITRQVSDGFLQVGADPICWTCDLMSYVISPPLMFFPANLSVKQS